MKLGHAEQTFLQTTVQNFLLPLNKFLEGDSKTIQRERQTLETKRLDLDACKSRARKAKTLELRQQVGGLLPLVGGCAASECGVLARLLLVTLVMKSVVT